MPAQIFQFPCLTDNFGVLVHDPASGATSSIDAPEAAPVEAALAKTGWRLTDILITHHHNDHTAGVGELKARHPCRALSSPTPKRDASRMWTKPWARAT